MQFLKQLNERNKVSKFKKHSDAKIASLVINPVAKDNNWTIACVGIFLAMLVWFVFGQTVHFEFVNYDDDYHVYANPEISGGLTLHGIAWAFKHSHIDYWHPLDFISHMLDCQIYGLQPSGHHFTNVLLHAAVAVLLFLVFKKMTGALWRSALVAAVFAIHPLRVESVAWVSERKDMLQGLFCMLTVGAYVYYTRKQWNLTRYLVVIAFFSLGLMCKPTLMALPLVLIVLDYWPLKRFAEPMGTAGFSQGKLVGRGKYFIVPVQLVIEKIPLILLSIASFIEAALGNDAAFISGKKYPHILQISNALVSYVDYLWQMIYPAKLAVLYPFPEKGLPLWEVLLALVLLVFISTAGFLLRKKYPYILVGWLWYVIMLLPMIGFIQAGNIARADRYTYLPQIGLYLLIIWAIADLSTRLRHRQLILASLSIIIIISLVFCARIQTAFWKNSETLWNRTLACTVNNATAHNNLGNFLSKSGRENEAIIQLQRAINIQPDYVEAECNLGDAFMRSGQLDEAIFCFRKAIRIRPDFTGAYSNLGAALLQKGLVNEAIIQLQRAIDIQADYLGPHINLGYAFLQIGQVRQAVVHFQKSLEIDSNNVVICKNLAWILATCPDGSIRNGSRAIELAEQANRLSDGKDPLVIATLAAAYAETGHYTNAMVTAKLAQHIALEQSNSALADELQFQIGFYQIGAPIRDPSQTNAPSQP
jgi:Tfp pilus assembly protein PilF